MNIRLEALVLSLAWDVTKHACASHSAFLKASRACGGKPREPVLHQLLQVSLVNCSSPTAWHWGGTGEAPCLLSHLLQVTAAAQPCAVLQDMTLQRCCCTSFTNLARQFGSRGCAGRHNWLPATWQGENFVLYIKLYNTDIHPADDDHRRVKLPVQSIKNCKANDGLGR